MKQFKYKTSFASIIKPIISGEKDRFLAQASLQKLRGFIPDIDFEKNYDLLGIASPLFNVNLFNKNDDGVDTAFALQVYKSFINKFYNLSHKRDLVVGCVLSAHLTEFNTDKLLTEEDVVGKKNVFNITVGGVLWRLVNEGLVDLIEESNSVLSENFDKIKSSFEIGFNDYKIVVCPSDSRALADGRIVEDMEEREKLTPDLKAFGGTGKLKDGSRVYRLLAGEGLGLGAAITESPAATLTAIAVPQTVAKEIVNSLEEVNKQLKNSIINKGNEILSNFISQSNNSDVINEENLTRTNMKINDIKEITDELLKEVKASSIVDFVEDKLKVASERFAQEKKDKEVFAAEVQKKHDELLKTHETLIKELETLKASLQQLEREKIAHEKQEKFNVRMASFEDKYELSQEEVAVIGAQIKDLDDEQYKKVETNLGILLKNKDKQTIAEQKKVQEAKASETKETKTAQQIVDDTINAAQNISKEVPATTVAQPQSLREKFAKAFTPDQFEVTK